MDLLMETSSRTPDIGESQVHDEALGDEPQEHNKPSNEAEIRSHVAWVIRSVSQSINDRTFDSAPAWKYIADDFLVSLAAPRIPTRTRAELAESFKSFAAEHHDFRGGAVDGEE
ncbi:hypothetical protein PRZ48_011890 [Zasmidium cellare]|uniref:Uncharacterized protein n=1 Tax=Zasmidium cellare TaxID=395010 RepID=A0ABR0E7P8_ZASCE|nr:hypothetical protein PRZ48_011890 [Zasmidium cellare]